MRIIMASLALCIAAPSVAGVGTKAGQLSSAKALKAEQGAVAISIRSEIFLPNPLEVYFLREGGNLNNDRDVIRFTRRQSMLAIGNDTTDYVVRVFGLAPGHYRLVAHGVDCPEVPRPGLTCGVTVTWNGFSIGPSISRPSRGYEGETPGFTVEAGKLTVIGDLILSNDNIMLWSPLPDATAQSMTARFGTLPLASAPSVPDPFLLKRPIKAKGMFDNYGRQYDED